MNVKVTDKVVVHVVGHSCKKSFSTFPKIITFFGEDYFQSLEVTMTLQSQQYIVSITEDYLKKTFANTSLLTNLLLRKLNKWVNDLFRKFKKNLKVGGLEETFQHLKSEEFQSEILNVEILQHSKNSQFPDRTLLVWIYTGPHTFIQVLEQKKYPCLMSLDTTHCISEKEKYSHSHLATLMFRMPNTLKYSILGQALIQGEDLESMRLFLDWISHQIVLSPIMITIDDSSAEKGAIKAVWPDAFISLCV